MQDIHVMVVEDDPSLSGLIATILRTQNYQVTVAEHGTEALAMFRADPPTLIVLDLMMPGMDGLEVCRQIRKSSQVPILILSGIDEEARKVKALDLGADDYLTKPFGTPELLARIRAILRRAMPGEGEGTPSKVYVGNMVFAPATRQAFVGGREVHLTRTECAILEQFIRHKDTLLTYDMILNLVWGPEYEGTSQYVHIYVGRLRNKLSGLEGAQIITVPTLGYRFLIGSSEPKQNVSLP